MKEKADVKTVVAFLMAILIFSMPLIVMAQQSEMEEARLSAEKDAEANTSGGLWLMIGCFGGVIGVATAYFYTPSPPASDLIGKSPEYVAYYTDFYKSKAKSIQRGKAWTGCIINGVANCVLTIVYVAAVIAASEY
jgi:drug/metabolite transporter (DMT)-like permease